MRCLVVDSLDDVTLPLEALGAREYVTRLYQRMRSEGDGRGTVTTDKSNSDNNDSAREDIHTSIRGDNGENHASSNNDGNQDDMDHAENDPFGRVGLPLPAATEPINEETGRRLVYFDYDEEPAAVLAERRPRFLRIVFALPKWSTGSVPALTQHLSACGTALGYSDDDTEIIWHERGDLYASRVSLSAIASMTCIRALQCLHCACVVPRDEVVPHLEQHVKGLGRAAGGGTFISHPVWGTACGDTGVLQRLQRIRKVGSGAQGDVYICCLRSNNNNNSNGTEEGNSNATGVDHGSLKGGDEGPLFAVKCMRSCDAVSLYHRAVRLMSLRHEHIIEYIAVRLLPNGHSPTHVNDSDKSGVVEVVMPFYREGDLAGLLRRTPADGKLQERRIATIALQTATALAVLHERNPPIAHGDLKVENLLLDNDGCTVVLTDLETCEEIARHHGAAAHVDIGTTAWMAPETRHHELTPASDMWALGLLLYVLAVLPDYPMMYNPNTNEEDLLNASVWRKYERSTEKEESITPNMIRMADCVMTNIIVRGYSGALAQLTTRLLSHDPAKRPKANRVREELTEIITTLLFEETGDRCELTDDTIERS